MNYGRYQILEELGRGSMGVVHKALDPQIDRIIALKVLRQDRVTSDAFVQRFLMEAKAIGRLSHPNIVTVYDVGQDQGMIYIAMELLEGTPLNEAVKEKGLGLEEIVGLCGRVAETLHYAHEKGIVHRDIKPTNIIITPSGQAKITDFGVARIEDPAMPQHTQAGEILGTPLYMPPEQVMGRPVDGRSDLYSLGVILYELTTGKRPFGGNNLAAIFRSIAEDTPPPPMEVNPSIPQELSGLVMKSLSRLPHERFQTGKAMAEGLKGCLGKEVPSTVPPPARRKKRRYLGLLVFVTLVVIGVVGGLSYYVTTRSTPEEAVTQSEKVVLPGFLEVECVPNGALVFLDGSFRGKAPLSLELDPGKYEVRLTSPDHYEWEAQVQLEGESVTPLFVKLIPMDEKNP